MIPSPLVLLVLALAAFRLFRLAAHDEFPPVAWARDRILGAHIHTGRAATFDRPLLADWLLCPWCSGAWYSAGWYGAWLLWPHGCLYAAVPFAISAAVGAAQLLMPE